MKTDKRTTPKIPAPGRDTSGRFLKGATGNPGGRPIEDSEVRALARAHGPAAVARLACLMHSDDPATCIAASKALLDRGFGKPLQAIDATVTAGPVTEYASFRDLDQVEAARAYQDLLASDRENRQVTFREPEHTEEWYAERDKQRAHEKELAEIAARPPGRPPAPAALARAPEPVAAAPEPRPIARPRPLKVVDPVDQDSVVLTVEQQEDARLRVLRPERVLT